LANADRGQRPGRDIPKDTADPACEHVKLGHADIRRGSGVGPGSEIALAVAEELAEGTLVELMLGALASADAPIWFLRPPGARVNRKTLVFSTLVKRAFSGF